MKSGSIAGVIFLVFLAGCASTVPEIKPPPKGLAWSPEAPFQRDKKVDIPPEAGGLAHFLKGQLLLSAGEFEEALKEFEAAVQTNPSDAFLHFRLATLYLRKGDLKKALVEAETAASLEPKNVENHLLLAGLYSSLG
ncbi:MAG TPA: tetratricopeptide repeat protein, partial [Candidatus Udaeobacter sp.]|nr:tetratricopeptide repeat protein [Candidatus Udaeobacter sp.]